MQNDGKIYQYCQEQRQHLLDDAEATEWKETTALWLFIGGMIIFAAVL